MDEVERTQEPVGAHGEAAAAPGGRPSAGPRRPRRLTRFGVIGLALVLVGGLGLWSDYSLTWFSTTAERTVPIIGVVNEGAPWEPIDREGLELAYADSTLYSLGYLIWTWLAWSTSIIVGLALVATDALRRWPRTQTRIRTSLLTLHLLAAGMMLLTVSRRFGRQFIDQHYNGIDYYHWAQAAWIQAAAAPLLVAAAAYLLWHLRRTHPPIGVPGVLKPHYGAFRLAIGTAGLVALALLLSPWLPIAEIQRAAIIGNRWLAEDALHVLAANDSGTQGLAGLGYVRATRALFVTAATAIVTAFGIIGWERTRSRVRARVWGFIAQVHLLAIVPLHLGLRSYNIYVQQLSAQPNMTLESNQFVGQAIDILLVTWIAHVMWILLPYLKRWPRPVQPVSADAQAPKEMGPEGGGHASTTETP